MLTERQFPFTEPYGLASGPLRSLGPTAEACKRFCGRMGLIPWQDYDRHYNKMLGDAMAEFKRKHGLPNDPSYGPLVNAKMRTMKVPKGRPNAGEYALDFPARRMVQAEALITSESEQEELVMHFIRQFWIAAINNENAWHYSQNRPVKVDVIPTASSVSSDCSGAIIQAVRYAGKMAKVEINDPAIWDFSGYGNTDLHEDNWPVVHSPYWIGDIAHFHSSRHVIQCIKAGTVDTAQWGSHGQENSPELVGSLRSYYRFPEEFMFVVRPKLLKD